MLAAHLAVGPPYGSLVFAGEAEMLACSAGGLAFVALLAAETAGEAAYGQNVLVFAGMWYPKVPWYHDHGTGNATGLSHAEK